MKSARLLLLPEPDVSTDDQVRAHIKLGEARSQKAAEWRFQSREMRDAEIKVCATAHAECLRLDFVWQAVGLKQSTCYCRYVMLPGAKDIYACLTSPQIIRRAHN